jgi:ketosteroid isomerase-like protein
MDPTQAIRLAKTQLRDAFRAGSVNNVLSIYADEYSDMSVGMPSFFGAESKEVFRHRLRELFKRYRAELAVTIISIHVFGDTAFDWGWHKLTLTPKNGGKPTSRRTRYLEIWMKDKSGAWRIGLFLDNQDVKPKMPSSEVLRALKARSRNARRKKS